MSEVLVGMVNRATESRHASGAEKEIPDIREYARGAPGYFQRWDPHSGTVTGRGRAFLLGKPPDELTYIKRLVTARRPLRDWNIPDLPPLALDGGQAAAATDTTTQEIAGLRAKLASITQTATQPPPAGPTAAQPPAARIPPGIPPQIGQTLLALLEAPEGTTASAAGLAIGKSKTVALEYLSLLRDRGIAITAGGGRSTRWHRAGTATPGPARPGPAPEDPPPPAAYVTVEALADAVHDGLVDVDDDTRAVLEQALQIRDRQRAGRPHLTVVHPPEDDTAGHRT